jgi:hypothetical protein
VARQQLQTTLRVLWQPNGGDPFPPRNSITVRQATDTHQEDTNAALVYAIRKLCEALECKVTIRTAQDYDDALEVIYSFHGWTFEEIAACFAMIRTGNLGENFYERFKAPQLNACMREYANMRARHHMRNQAKYMDGIHNEAPATLRSAHQMSHIADLLQLPAYQPQRTTLADYGERQQGVPAAAHQAQSEAQGEAADARAGGEEGRPVVQQSGAL